MTKPRSKNRMPPRKTKRKSADSHPATKAPPKAANVAPGASPVVSTSDAAAEALIARLPDPSPAVGAFLEYLRLKEKRFRENPNYVMEVYRRYKPAPEWVQKQIDEW